VNEREKELVINALKGDSAAFGALVDLYWQRVSVFVYQKLAGETEAQDVVQETFIKAYHRLPQLRKTDKFVAWLYRIAARLCTDYLRAKEHRTVSLESVEEKQKQFAASTERGADEFLGELLSALQRLPEKYREVVILRFIGEFTCNDISLYLGEPEGTIRNRLFRANELLKEHLKQAIKKSVREKSAGREA
jgi:RNA polymerase sigma-70 factor (ECF subfamily)